MKNLVDITTASELLTLGMVWEATSPRPTLDSAANWLREAKGLHVSTMPTAQSPVRWRYTTTFYKGLPHGDERGGLKFYETYFDSHVQALSAAISHSLKMIKGL